MRNFLLTLVLFMSGAMSLPALAVIETYDFTSPDLEQRYQDLSAELRCPKCQNQNIADSNAPIARDLRVQLHRQLELGASDLHVSANSPVWYRIGGQLIGLDDEDVGLVLGVCR